MKKIDPAAAGVFALVGTLASTGLLARLGVSEALALQLVLWGMFLAAFGRALYERWADDRHLSLAEVVEVVQQLSSKVGELVETKPKIDVPDHEEILK